MTNRNRLVSFSPPMNHSGTLFTVNSIGQTFIKNEWTIKSLNTDKAQDVILSYRNKYNV